MRREGPSLWGWLTGRLAHPPDSSACRRCGRVEAGGSSRVLLRRAGLETVAHLAGYCTTCRREVLLEALSTSHKVKT